MADDNFFVNPKRVSEICSLIIKEKLNKRFGAHARLEIAKHPDVLEKAYEAGFRVMLMGIESPHDKVLNLFNKGFTRKDIEESFAVLTTFPFTIMVILYLAISARQRRKCFISLNLLTK